MCHVGRFLPHLSEINRMSLDFEYCKRVLSAGAFGGRHLEAIGGTQGTTMRIADNQHHDATLHRKTSAGHEPSAIGSSGKVPTDLRHPRPGRAFRTTIGNFSVDQSPE